ncbi:MAG: hypothetical protein C0394_04040 [Syntrophus sp. (in: bacteria)]|nr:hypothetical protein [Syntrophus sp. (in: bacteria)]
MKKIGFVVLCFAVMLLLMHTGLVTTALGASKKKAVPAKEVKEEKDILVKIGDKVITKAEFDFRLAALPPEYQARFQDARQKWRSGR